MSRDPMEFVGLALGGAASDGAPSGSDQVLSIQQQARLVGGYHWVERRLFEVLGAWVASEPSAEAQLLFDIYSHQHAWHADLFAERLPVSVPLGGEDLTSAPFPEVAQLFDLLTRGSGGTLLRLVGLSRIVLPRLVAGFTLHLRRSRPVSEAPVLRAVRLTLRDELEEWQVCEALVQSLARRPHDIEVVTSYQARLEELVAEGGPGLVRWPDPGTPGDPAPSGPGPTRSGRTDEAGTPPTVSFAGGSTSPAMSPASRVPVSVDGAALDGPVDTSAQVTEATATVTGERGT